MLLDRACYRPVQPFIFAFESGDPPADSLGAAGAAAVEVIDPYHHGDNGTGPDLNYNHYTTKQQPRNFEAVALFWEPYQGESRLEPDVSALPLIPQEPLPP